MSSTPSTLVASSSKDFPLRGMNDTCAGCPALLHASIHDMSRYSTADCPTCGWPWHLINGISDKTTSAANTALSSSIPPSSQAPPSSQTSPSRSIGQPCTAFHQRLALPGSGGSRESNASAPGLSKSSSVLLDMANSQAEMADNERHAGRQQPNASHSGTRFTAKRSRTEADGRVQQSRTPAPTKEFKDYKFILWEYKYPTFINMDEEKPIEIKRLSTSHHFIHATVADVL